MRKIQKLQFQKYKIIIHNQATMLKKVKNKMKRRNTEPSMALAGQQMSLALPPTTAEGDSESEIASNNTDF